MTAGEAIQSPAHASRVPSDGAPIGQRQHAGLSPVDLALKISVIALGCILLANCTASHKLTSKVDPRYGVSASPRVIEPGQPVPKGGGTYRVGKPYYVAGKMYVPEENRRYRDEGTASWYGDDFHGRLTANGEVYDMNSVSAAHPTMPMPSYARVTNVKNGRSLIVRVNDRGPYHDDRVIDLSGKAAELLDFRGKGLARVRVEYVGPAALEGSDDRKLMATLREGAPAPAPSAVMLAATKPFLPDAPRVNLARSEPGLAGHELRRGESFAAKASDALRRHEPEPVFTAGPRGAEPSAASRSIVAASPSKSSLRQGSDSVERPTARPGAIGDFANARGLY
jgi:rare lipoprotein A